MKSFDFERVFNIVMTGIVAMLVTMLYWRLYFLAHHSIPVFDSLQLTHADRYHLSFSYSRWYFDAICAFFLGTAMATIVTREKWVNDDDSVGQFFMSTMLGLIVCLISFQWLPYGLINNLLAAVLVGLGGTLISQIARKLIKWKYRKRLTLIPSILWGAAFSWCLVISLVYGMENGTMAFLLFMATFWTPGCLRASYDYSN